MEKLLSLCIPTNGRIEYVLPALESIYNQGISNDLFEVIVTDNGSNIEFEKLIQSYLSKYNNLVYKKTNALGFLNQIESFKIASGKLIKFINHRSLMLEGSINYLLEFSKKHDEKCDVYFLNGAINKKNKNQIFDNFNDYVLNLSIYSSWSSGVAIWKKDFCLIPVNTIFNTLFPHTTMLFYQRWKKKYIIDNTILSKNIDEDATKKGKYNLFYAFAVEYPTILLNLYQDRDINLDTFLTLKRELYKFLKLQYFQYIFLKRKCSYDISNSNELLGVYYSVKKIKMSMPILLLKRGGKKIVRLIFNRKRK